MIILGIDPGFAIVGFGVLEAVPGRQRLIRCGAITTPAGLPLPAYDCVMKCSHAFNLLDSRGALSAVERANYILRVRTVAKACCEAYLAKLAAETQDAKNTEGEVA